jgi:hypothetical protein
MKNALTVFRGTSNDKKAKVQTERAEAEARIAQLTARRAARLIEDDSVAAVDQIDQAIAHEHRTIVICQERLAVIDAAMRREARERREEQRQAAIKIIAGRLAKRTAKTVELESVLKRVGELFNEINDDKPLREAWPFASALPNFSWRLYDLGRQVMYALRRANYEMIPSDVGQYIGWPGVGDGVSRALPIGPRLPDDLPGIVARNAERLLENLRKADIHPLDEDDADETGVAA